MIQSVFNWRSEGRVRIGSWDDYMLVVGPLAEVGGWLGQIAFRGHVVGMVIRRTRIDTEEECEWEVRTLEREGLVRDIPSEGGTLTVTL
jgi:hypothetical protein